MALAVCLPLSANGTTPSADVDFNRDVRPILSDACFQCHGPDPSHREASLRLDTWSGDDQAMGAEQVIEAGDASASTLIDRVSTDDASWRMPPPHSGKELSADQIEVLRRWVAQGAEYQPHWAFVRPERWQVPEVDRATWPRNPIDRFVLARLESEGLAPSPPADSRTLLRRLYLDTLGLPPTLDQQQEADGLSNDEQYAEVVDKLLASPHFGERWGRLWLDVASYADSNGFEKDRPREVWMYRDWVVDALNADKPYDQFVVEQVAGDLLADAGQDERVATGFLRNTMVNEEGGIDPEQFRMEGLFARMEILGKSVLGLTVQCAQCHTHKYDPISHREYYRMLAFLNDSHEAYATVYTDEDSAKRERIQQEIAEVERALRDSHPDWRERMIGWARASRAERVNWQVVRPELDGSGGQKHSLLEDGSVLAQGYAPAQVTTQFSVEPKLKKVTAVRLELLTHPTLPHRGPGRSTEGLCALSEFKVTLGSGTEPIKIAAAYADLNPPERPLAEKFDDGSDRKRTTGPVAFAIDGDDATAWGIDQGLGRSNVSHTAVFVFDKAVDAEAAKQLTFHLAQLHGESYHEDLYTNNLGRFRFSVTDAEQLPTQTPPPRIVAILDRPANTWSASEEAALFSYWRKTVPEWQQANDRIEELWQEHPAGVSQLVLEKRQRPRATHVLERGDFLRPAEQVSAGVPEVLHDMEAEDPTRLDFARWLVDKRSPVAARVIVNRIWQSYFGIGLVETAEDFGMQGTTASHRELLDWLAVELMENDWRLKHVHRLILDSATYRQASIVSPPLLERDPRNRLLARGARFRTEAEVIRDVSLAASGLLDRTLGGPSVYPPAPEFLFKPPVSYTVKPWPSDTGAGRYRRGLYTFRYRSLPYPVYQTFDAPSGEASCARRNRSNTPTQALVSLNESLFTECARALAEETLASGVRGSRERIDYMYRRCVSRPPRESEVDVMLLFVEQQKSRIDRGELDPQQLLGDFDADDKADLATWMLAGRVILNLDETITRQ